MTTPHRKQARLLLILFLVLYAAFTLLPVGVWAVYRLGHSPDGATSSGETASSPGESSLPGTASQNEASALEEEEPLGSSPAPSSTTTPGFLEGREPTLSPKPFIQQLAHPFGWDVDIDWLSVPHRRAPDPLNHFAQGILIPV